MSHIPVLQKEVIKYLNPFAGGNFIDATFGEGGHGLEILKIIKPKGKLLGIEIDPILFEEIKEKYKEEENLILVNDSYLHLPRIIEKYRFRPIKGILFDLGISRWHLEKSKRGFSFQKDQPLDMRFDPVGNNLTAFEIVNYWPQKKIEKILQEYGEEPFARKIAKEIVARREIKTIRTTFELVEIIKKCRPFQKRRIHPATKTFQALRIAVNRELSNLEEVLGFLPKILDKEARMAIISFHSLEDRIIKRKFKEAENKGLVKILTKKPIVPSEEEILNNPSARSAKLRVAQVI